ncbi:unnamed protein product [Ectocarpus fasciculatus]
MRRGHRRPLPLAWRLCFRPSRDVRCLRPLVPGAAAVLMLLVWIDLLSLAVAADHHAVAASSTKACGRRFLVRDGEASTPDSSPAAGGLLLSRGRGFMGAVMVDDPAVILFAGGIGRGGMVVDSNVDVFAVPLDVADDDDDDEDNATGGAAVGGGREEAMVDRNVLSLGVARTDMGAGGTRSALFFAGGCGMEDSGDDNEQETHSSGPTIVQDGGGGGDGVAVDVPPGGDPDVPLLLKNCQATDAVDVFLLGGGGDGAQERKGKLSLLPPDAVRLCEPKYAATVGVFFTGSPDEGDPSAWAPTAHVLVAGGIIPTGGGEGGGQYTATSTVDIFRDDGIDEATGEVN